MPRPDLAAGMRGVPWRIAAVVLAYAAACAAVSGQYFLVAGAAWGGGHATLRSLFSGFVITAMTALPGFAVLRAALWRTGSRALWRFALAGGINGVVALSILARGPVWDLWFLGMGLVAGAVYWWVEAGVWRMSGQG